MNQTELNEAFDRAANGYGLGLPKDCNCRGLDFSGKTIYGRGVYNADFTGSKFVNTKFDNVDLEGCNFTDCDLRGTSFWQCRLTKAIFKGARLNTKTNFSHAELAEANFAGCDMAPLFSGGNLPFVKNIDKAIIAAIKGEKAAVQTKPLSQITGNYYHNDDEIKVGAAGALDMNVWHAHGEDGYSAPTNFCKTTHCRGGWAITLLGRRGKDMEERLGNSAAAALIYAASGSHPVPDWYTSTDEAWKDISNRARRKC